MNEVSSSKQGSDWHHKAACRDEDPELFFPVGSTTRHDKLQIADAKQVCRRCDVRETCLDRALQTEQAHGVWGGLDEDERKALLRKMGRLTRRSQV